MTITEGDGLQGEVHEMATRYGCEKATGLDLIVKLKPHTSGLHAGLLQIELKTDGTYTLDTSMVTCACCRRKYDELTGRGGA